MPITVSPKYRDLNLDVAMSRILSFEKYSKTFTALCHEIHTVYS